MLRRVYGFGYEIMAVISVTTITSVTGYWPSLLNLRKRHHHKLPLMNSVPMTPCQWKDNEQSIDAKREHSSLTPMIPSITNGTSSKKIHGL